MIDLGKDIVMDDEFIRRLNMATDIMIQEKEKINLDYNLLEKVMKKVVRNGKKIKLYPGIITIIEKEEMIEVILDFFKSIDKEFYEKAKELLLQRNKDVKMNIYDVHSISDFQKKDEFGIHEYTRNGSICSKDGRAIVHIPLKENLKSNESKVLDENIGTLEDCFTGVHEISHLFDLNLEDTLPAEGRLLEENRYKLMFTRNLLGESTTIAFEKLFAEYLLNNTEYSNDTIKYITQARINNTFEYARHVYIRLLLSKEKVNNKEITLNYIEEIMRNNNISIREIRNIAGDIVNYPKEMLWENRYAIAGLISPRIVEKYKNEGILTIKKYLKSVKEDNFDEAIQVLGIEKSERGLNELITTKKIQEENFMNDEQR